MRLAIFDLDNTLLANDSDYLWGQFLAEIGVVDRASHEAGNKKFYADYAAGVLDIQAFYKFSLAPFTTKTVAEWKELRKQFFSEKILPFIAPKTPALLAHHRAQGDVLLITTATNRFITEPIAEFLGVDALIAADAQIENGRFTGQIAQGNFQAEKVTRLKAWIAEQNETVEHMTAYSDSRNDIPLLQFAHEAIAVDADAALTQHAQSAGWRCISLRH